ncbi:hypothetical protein PLICRDRAFT_170328 [Plicaturopsis crispa FD-325 SS-3]|nr:hypothetical protein PLICRDRAFT_170328 [Plicaturopsis crispa FD-325 SS-3]
MAPRILICGDIVWAHDEVKELLGDLAEVVRLDSTSRADFLANLKLGGKYAGIVGVYRHNTSADRIGLFDKEIIAALAPSVKWIAHNGAGYDQIDVLECKAKGIKVSNTPGAVDDATATTALYLLISTLRHFSAGERSLRALQWKPAKIATVAHDAAHRTLAIFGLGGIGLRLAHYAHAFPMRVIYHNRNPNVLAPEWCEYYGPGRLEEFLKEADVLSVHVPLKENTVGIVGEKEIRALKKGSIIINTARGKVIDEDAMIRALEDGHLSNVGLDVFPEEPKVNPRLLEFPQLVLLPHMGTENQDAQRLMEVRALTNLRDFLKDGAGKDLVPELK